MATTVAGGGYGIAAPRSTPIPAPRPTTVPAATATPAPVFAPQERPVERLASRSAAGPFTQELERAAAQQAAQERIIVRTVDMTVSVANVARAVDDIGSTAARLGGWVVSTDRSEKHRGSVSLRVPAEKLDAALAEIRRYAVDVESEVSTSKDVTDEYVDLASRLRNLEATEQALLK
ncbi:MAG: DUF4349 domain-containing protein, partial [Chloroflexi bacterium]|nr:DUF4349 domain-containing protein [Chloroflexota bacterium]